MREASVGSHCEATRIEAQRNLHNALAQCGSVLSGVLLTFIFADPALWRATVLGRNWFRTVFQSSLNGGTMRSKDPKLAMFHGWGIVLGSATCLFIGYGPVVATTFSVFLKPLSEAFHWNRAHIALAFSIAYLIMSLTLPIAGRLLDKVGGRKVILFSTLLLGFAFMSLSELSPNIWRFYAVFVLLGLASAGTSTMPYSYVISQWFDRNLGLALGLATTGSGLGAFVLPSLAQALIVRIGWRDTYLVLGALILAISLPVIITVIKDSPDYPLPPSTAVKSAPGENLETELRTKDHTGEQPKPGMSTREAIRTRNFWFLVVTFFLVSMCVHGFMAHLAALLMDRSTGAQSAAFAVSLLGAALLLGRIMTGYLLDRFNTSDVAILFFSGLAVGVFIFWIGLPGRWCFVGAFLVGLGSGAEGDIIPFSLRRYFGPRSFGELYGYAFAIYTTAGALSPFLMGLLFDAKKSYNIALATMLVATAVAIFCMLSMRSSPTWEKRPDRVLGNNIGSRLGHENIGLE